MTSQQKTYLAGAIAVLVVIGLIWWGSQRQVAGPASQNGEPIKIGAIFMLSGVGSSWGQNSQRGADLAVQEINDAGGVNDQLLEMMYEDNQSDDPKQAVSALNNLASQGIKIVLGTNWTPSGLAIAPIACQRGILLISPTVGVAEFNEQCDYIFNLWVHDDIISRKLGEYLVQQGHRKLAILGSLQEWDRTQAEAVRAGFEASGVSVVSFQLPAQGQADSRTEITRIRTVSPDAIVLTNFGGGSIATAAKQIRQMGINVPLYSVALDNSVISAAEGALENAVVITSLTSTQEFSRKFEKAYGTLPDVGADTSYDAVMLIADAMRETGSTDPSVLKEYLGKLTSYQGASGEFEFDGKRGVVKEAKFLTVKEGRLVEND